MRMPSADEDSTAVQNKAIRLGHRYGQLEGALHVLLQVSVWH